MSKANAAKVVVLAAVIAGALFFARSQRAPQPLAVGDRAPDFSLPTLASGTFALRDYRQRVVVLNFWATWCPPCIEETPSLVKFSAQMQLLGVQVVGVSVDRDEAALKKFVSDYRLTFPIARDPDQAVASRYGTSKFPETYILDRDGRVAEKLIGAADWQDPRIIRFVESLVRPEKQTAQ